MSLTQPAQVKPDLPKHEMTGPSCPRERFLVSPRSHGAAFQFQKDEQKSQIYSATAKLEMRPITKDYKGKPSNKQEISC